MSDWDRALEAIQAEDVRLRAERAGLKCDLALAHLGRTLNAWDRKFRVDQLREPNGRWADEGARREQEQEGEPQIQPVFHRPGRSRNPLGRTVEGALAIYNALRLAVDENRIIAFKSEDYSVAPGTFETTFVGKLVREDVQNICDKFDTVQRWTNEATDKALKNVPALSPQQFGTRVHTDVARRIRNQKDPDFQAEQSRIKEGEAKYGDPGSIRIDAYQRSHNDTVCVYDIKTGRAVLTSARIEEIVRNASSLYGGPKRLIITEVRPYR